MAARTHTRFRTRALLGLGFVAALVLAACGAAGGGTGAAQTSTGKTAGGSAAAGVPAGMPTATSLKGWHVVVGSGGVGPQIDTTMGDPKGPSLQLPGDKSYVWADLKKPINSFSFDVNTQGLFDFIFGANSSTGAGYMFRIDTRGGTNYSGFAQLENWTNWDCPGQGSTSDPANTWIHVSVVIKGTNVTATETGPGGLNEVNTFNGATVGCTTMTDGTVLPSTLGNYKPLGNAFGFNGDGLGATSYTYIANFT